MHRWAFYINLPIGGLALPVYIFMLPSPDPQPGASLRARLAEIDWVGSILFIGAAVSLTLAINFGGILYAWDSGSEIALFVVAGVLFIVFGLQQAFCVLVRPDRRLIPVNRLFKPKSIRTVLLMFATTAAGGCGIFVPVYFIPLFFQFTRGDSPIQAAVRLLPSIVALVFSCLLQGGLLSHPSGKFGVYVPWFTVGGALCTVGAALMYVVDIHTSTAWVYGSSTLLSFGVGLFAQSGFAIAQASVPESEAALASAFITLAQTGGITISLAISNAIFINGAEDRLAAILPPNVSREQIQAAIAGVGGDFVGMLPHEMQVQVLEAIVEAIRRPYILVMTAGALVVVLSAVMKRERLFLAGTAVGV